MRRLIFIGAALVAALMLGLQGSPAGAQQGASITITSPANGATITGPVSVTVDIPASVLIKPAAEGDPNAFHYHLLVDVDPATVIQPGQPLPVGQANIIHTADKTVSVPNLAPGQHTITVVLTRTDHVPLSPSVQDRVQFTVAAAGQATPAAGAATPSAGAPGVSTPRTGAAATGSDARLPWFAWLVGFAALGGTVLYLRRRERRP